MTDFDRTIMMLTAMGINASKLDEYTTPDNPFVDSKGNVITDLTACLYNYSGGYTINGPIFALIALDMGKYTIPKNAVWTREKLLETILDHKYGSDGFGVDMVGMLMQSIAPYPVSYTHLIMNLYYIIGWVRPFSLKAAGAAYISSFFFDLSHGICTALVLWLVGETWVRKLLRIKKKFGLTGEIRRYELPPSFRAMEGDIP